MEKVGAIMDQVQTETVEFFDVYDAMERMQKLALEEYGKKIGAKSKEEGKIEKTIEMALKMLESGVSLDIIQKCSGLSDSGMEELISKYNKSLESTEDN
ncbi:MAG: hypothetical protein J6A58_02485 [Oscillospiraceae bacterium]|nr:hypothetical protein [Oscillospiraceae bacterium]